MAVERIKKKQETRELGRLKLYRDDLEAIAQALAEFGELEFTVNDELTGTEPGDFATMRSDLPERLERVEMRATKGESAIRVELGPSSEIMLVEPDMTARGVLNTIENICESRRISVLDSGIWVPTVVLHVLLFSMIVAISMLDGADLGRSFLIAAGVVGALSAISAMVATGMVFIIPRDYLKKLPTPPFAKAAEGTILNVPRAERPTFVQRLVADGGVSAFWSVVGLICGGAISWIVNQFPGL